MFLCPTRGLALPCNTACKCALTKRPRCDKSLLFSVSHKYFNEQPVLTRLVVGRVNLYYFLLIQTEASEIPETKLTNICVSHTTFEILW